MSSERTIAQLHKERKLQKQLGYYNSLLTDTNTFGGKDLELLAPGVNRAAREDGAPEIIRHLDAFYPLSITFADTEYLVTQAGAEQLLGLIMAQHHFNNRIPDIVPELADMECDIKFSMDVYDTHFEPTLATRQLYQKIVASSEPTLPDANKYPTGLLGALMSTVTGPLAILGGVYNLTQVSFGSSANSLDNKDVYPYFGRIVTSVGGTARVLAEYYKQELQARSVYVIYSRDDFGVDYFSSFQSVSTEIGFTIQSTPLTLDCAEGCRDFDEALRNLAGSDFRYVLAILTESHFKTLMPKAKNYKKKDSETNKEIAYPLVGDDRFWTFAYQLGNTFQVDETLAAATNGTATIRTAEGERLKGYSAYTKAWQETILSDEALQLMQSMLPAHVLETANYPSYTIPQTSELSVFSYDSFMALALASCAAAAKHGTLFTGEHLYDAFLSSNFTGATGNVRFDPKTGTRSTETADLTIANYLASDDADNETGMYTIRSVDTHIFNGEHFDAVPDQPSFIYADGTTTAPLDLPPVDLSLNEIAPWASGFGYLACALIMTTTIGICVWVQHNQATDPIRASQPFFIYMLGVGIVLMAVSLIPLAALPASSSPHVACNVGPWFLSIGFCVTFAALFSKLLRINCIDRSSKKMVRVTIKPHQVLRPFFILLALNLVILISWAVVSPLEYVPDEADYDRFGRPTLLVFSCQSKSAAWFRLALGSLDVAALTAVAYNAYKASKVKVAYDESNYIYLGLLISSQSFFIGVPGVIAAGADPSAAFFSRTLAVMWACLTIILPIIIPKIGQIKKWRLDKIRKEQRKQERLARANQFFNSPSAPTSSQPSQHTAASICLSTTDAPTKTPEDSTNNVFNDSMNIATFNDSNTTQGMNGSMTESGRFFT